MSTFNIMKYCILLLTLVLAGCHRSTYPIDKAAAHALTSIEQFHGSAAFSSLSRISYTKRFVLYQADGAVERSVTQHHKYHLNENHYEIRSITGQDTTLLLAQKGALSKHDAQGNKLPIPTAKLQKELNTSLYVYRLPHNLRDPGVQLTHLGKEQIDGQQAVVLLAQYNPLEHDNHSTGDQWFFMATTEGEIIANKIYTADHKSWVDNLSWHDMGGWRFYHHRKSYRLDEHDQKTYLRAEYWYENVKIVR